MSSYAAFVGFSVNAEERLGPYDADCPDTKISIPPPCYNVFPGGSGLNIYNALTGAGQATKLFAAVGDGRSQPDLHQPTIHRFLEGQDVIYLPVRDGKSSLAVVLQKIKGKKQILSCKTPILPEKVGEFSDIIRHHLTTFHPPFVVLTGLLPDELELAKPFLEYQLGKTVLCPHVSLIRSGHLEGLLKQVDYLFLSAYECKPLFGKEVTLRNLSDFAKKHGLDFVSASRHKHDVMVATRDDAFLQPYIKHNQPELDTTGAGDAFVGGALIAFLKGLSARKAALYGSCLARLSCTIEGAANLPPWKDVEDLVAFQLQQQ